jgi:hypothetical protein
MLGCSVGDAENRRLCGAEHTLKIFIGLSRFECIKFAMFATEQSIYVGHGNTGWLGQREFAPLGLDRGLQSDGTNYGGRSTTAKPTARRAARG